MNLMFCLGVFGFGFRVGGEELLARQPASHTKPRREVGLPGGGSMGLGQELVLDAQKGVTDEFQCAIW